MKRGVKIALIISLAMLVLFGLVLWAVWYFQKEMISAGEEGREFAQNADKYQCLEEMGRQLQQCDSPGCIIRPMGFGLMCLEIAEGDRAEFCDEFSQGKLTPETYCKGEDENVNKACETTIKEGMYNYCNTSRY